MDEAPADELTEAERCLRACVETFDEENPPSHGDLLKVMAEYDRRGGIGDSAAGALAELERLRAGLARVAEVCDAADEQYDYVTADVDTDVIRLAILDRRDEAPTRVLRDEVAAFLSVGR